MTNEPYDYDIPLEGYEAALGNDLSKLQARIKELKAMIADQINSTGDDPQIMAASRAEWAARAKVAEAKLAKAIKTLECYAGHWADDKTFIRTDDGGELASETIAELTGGKDD